MTQPKIDSRGYAIAALAVAGGVLGALLLVVVVIVAASASQPPSPAPAEASQEKQQQGPSEDQVGANKDSHRQPSPTVFAQDDGNGDAGGKSHKGTEGSDPAATDWNFWVATFTGALVIVALLQALIAGLQAFIYRTQAGYMREGLRSTREAAEAATKSAHVAEQALHTAERAYIDVPEARLVQSFVDDGRNLDVYVYYKVTNTGRTPAKITRAATRWHIRKGDIPGQPTALDCDFRLVGQLPAKDSRPAEGHLPNKMPKAQFDEFEAGQLGYWVSIVVDFADAFDKTHSEEFWWRHTPGDGGGFDRCPAPPHSQPEPS